MHLFATVALVLISMYGNASDFDDARSAFEEGMAQVQADHYERAVPLLDAFIQKFGGTSHLETQQLVALAMANEALSLDQLNKRYEAMDVYDQLISQYGNNHDRAIQQQVLSAMSYKGGVLVSAGHSDLALPFLDKVITNGHILETPEFQNILAKSYVNKEIYLINMKKYNDAMVLHDEAIKRLEASPDTADYYIAWLFHNLSRLYLETNRPSQAVATITEMDRRFGNSSDLGIQLLVVNMLFNKGVTLMDQLKWEEAHETFIAIIEKYGLFQEPELQHHIAGAMVGAGYSSYEIGNNYAYYAKSDQEKIKKSIRSYTEAIASYDQAIQRYGENQQIKVKRAVIKAYFNKTAPYVAMRKYKEAIANIDQGLSKFSPPQDSEIGVFVSLMQEDRIKVEAHAK